MKHILTLLVALTLSCTAQAQLQKLTAQNGQATNGVIAYGTNKFAILNSITNVSSIDIGVATNLGNHLRNLAVPVTSQNVGIGIAGSASGAATTAIDYTFQRSMDAVNWKPWTNIAITPAGTTPVHTNVVFVLGDYHYFRVNQITNPNAAIWRSNTLEFYWKQ